MHWTSTVQDNWQPAALGVGIVVVSFNRLLRFIWPLALLVPLVPLISTAYSGFSDTTYGWSYVPIIVAIVLRRKIGAFPRR